MLVTSTFDTHAFNAVQHMLLACLVLIERTLCSGQPLQQPLPCNIGSCNAVLCLPVLPLP